MATLGELINKRNELPIGDIYEKHISGKTYYYHQYFKNGKRYSEIVKSNDLADLLSKINEGKRLDALINEYKLKDKSIVISNSALNLTGNLMRGNTTVASFNNGVLIFYDTQLAPLIIKRTKSIEAFLKLRVIDMSRTNARLLKKVLNINPDEEYKTPLYSYALSISDNYWFKPKHSKLKYKDIKFTNDIYSDVSLKGDTTVFPHRNKLTPEITTTGSFEKGWKLINGEWWLYKNGNDRQIFSELFCCAFAKLIGVNTVMYEYDNGHIRSKNFASKVNFEPIASLADDNDQYDYIFGILTTIDEQIAKDYLKLIFFDTVVNNVDRHNENVGLLRDRKTGKIVSLSPNFDNNLALVSTENTLKDPNKDGFVKYFADFIKSNKKAHKLLKTVEFINIDIKQIESIISNIPISLANKDDIAEKVYIRYKYLKDLL